MKLTIERATLLRSLSHVQSVVERRNTIPILSNVLMSATDGTLSLSATDMEVEIVESLAAEVEQSGSTTAPAHTLYDIVRKLPDGAQIELDAPGEGGGALSLRSGRSTFRLGCLPTADFPQMTGTQSPHAFELPADDLRGMIDRTRFAISTEETRYYLNGIYIHATSDPSGALRAVATDGHRLARVEVACPEGATEIPGVIVPRKTVIELRKLIDEAVDAVSIELSDTKIKFAFDDVVLTSKLIDGTFPDYERVIPQSNDKSLAMDAKTFAQAVDRVSTIATEKSRAVKLQLESGQLTLTANSPDADSAKEELEVDYAGDGLEIGFNARYLIDITSQVRGEFCRFEMADPASPTVILDTGDETALYVLMPMRV